MAYMNHPYDDTPFIRGEAAAAMTAPAMLAVKYDASGKLAFPSAGDFCIGIVVADNASVNADETLTVQIKDICYWTASAAITKGALLKADASGKAAAASAGEVVLAVALEAGVADKPMKVMICHTAVPASGN